MKTIVYPRSKTDYDLSGIITIEVDDNIDFIILGNQTSGSVIGYIVEDEGLFLFRPEDENRSYGGHSTYEGCFVDIMIEIACNSHYAHEFAVLATRKQMELPF